MGKVGKLSFVFHDEDLPYLQPEYHPILSYGSELRVAERAMERIMIGVTRKDRVKI